jgi:glycosyltransferase involved in cell wall biosynthesis
VYRIVHVTGYYIDTMSYQENIFPAAQKKIGNSVYIITSSYFPDFVSNPKDCKQVSLRNSVPVIRIKGFFHIKNKLPFFLVSIKLLKRLNPDIVFVHDSTPNIILVVLYKLLFNKKMFIQIDFHSEVGKDNIRLLGRVYHFFYKILYKIVNSQINQVFGVGPECVEFAKNVYGFRSDKVSLLPLPSTPSKFSKIEMKSFKIFFDKEYRNHSSDIILVHSGKLPGRKRTFELLEAFNNSKNVNLVLVIVGKISKKLSRKIIDISNRKRVYYYGWASTQEILKIYHSSDLMIQPGSLSHSFVDAISCGLPIVLDDTPQGRYLTNFGNGVIIDGSSTDEIQKLLNKLDSYFISELKSQSEKIVNKFNGENIARISLNHLK